MNRGVVITGTGAISAAGHGVAPLWEAARDGRSCVRPLDIPHVERLRIRIGANVENFDPASFLDQTTLRCSDRYSQLALAAADEAVANAGLTAADLSGPRVAAIIASGGGGLMTMDEGCYEFYCGSGIEPMAIARFMPSAATSLVSIRFGITGPCFAVTSACASASQAIGLGMQMIRAGLIDRAIVGGAEACLTPTVVRAWELLRVLTPRASRPFSADRSGMVLGEGAGVFVLESDEAAAARGAVPLVRLAGYGTSSDARDMVQPDVDGASTAMRDALADARLDPAAIGYVNAHGTGTALNDRNEAAALRAVFGAAIDAIPVSSTKPVIGHALGASGALELVVTIEALRNQIIPPQINFTRPDPACDLNLPTEGPVPTRMTAAMSNSFAFGGINAALVVTLADST